jgi:protein involved in polysaccharide export with SLBB domain
LLKFAGIQQKIKMNTKKTFLKFLFASIIVCLFTLENGYAQVAGVDPNNLGTVRVDEMTDAQILDILKQGQTAGLSVDQAAQLAIKRGLNPNEVDKFNARVAKLQTGATPTIAISNSQDNVILGNEVKAAQDKAVTGKVLNEIKTEAPIVNTTVYGQSYFREGDIKIFNRSTDAKAPSNYIIGIGDEFGISVFGYSYYNEVLKVDARGAINPNNMGPIFIKGLAFDKAKSVIRSKMGQYFDLGNNKVEIALVYARNITVNIVGEVLKPGSYNFPAINSAFNALIVAGGPSNIGTLRNIQIKRNGKLVKSLDVYAFLNDANAGQDFFLEENDYIIVGSAQKVVKLSGAIQRPANFELLPNENLADVIQYAGGFTANAYASALQVRRIENKEIKLLDVNFDSLKKINKDFTLKNGDEILVRSSVNEVLNKVSVQGAINFPGEYHFNKASTVQSLINIAGGLKNTSQSDWAYVIRTQADLNKAFIKVNLKDALAGNTQANLTLQPLDELVIYNKIDYLDNTNIEVFGAVRNAGAQAFTKGITLGDAIKNAGGLTLSASNSRIELSRLSYFSPNYKMGEEIKVIVDTIRFDSKENYLTEANAKINLQPYDQIFIRNIPEFSNYGVIEITGEVIYPGKYPLLNKDEKIASVVKRAGGLTRFAFPEAATFYRPSLPGNYIVIKLKKAIKFGWNRNNYLLKDGDVLNVPLTQDLVSIKGNALNYSDLNKVSQVNAPYLSGRRAGYYIRHYGSGFSDNAWRRKTYVIQPNAKINRTKRILFYPIYPAISKGSVIYVVTKEKKVKADKKKEGEPFDSNKFVEKLTTKITGLATLFILLKQVQ